MHVRESIMQNIQTTLEGIVAVGQPAPDSGNSGTPANLILQSGGTFTGTALISYLATVTTGGVSGVAQITVTGSDPSGPHTVTSGLPVAIGSNGITLTFTIPAGEALVAGDKWTVAANTYNNTVKDVMRAHEVGVTLSEFPSIIFAETTQAYTATENKYDNEMRVEIEGWMDKRDQMATQLNGFLEDIENALQADQLRGGYAFDTQFVNVETGLPEKDRPFGVVAIELNILFKQAII